MGDDPTHTTFHASIAVDPPHRVYFTDHVLDPSNPLLAQTLQRSQADYAGTLAILDRGLLDARPDLSAQLQRYFDRAEPTIAPLAAIETIPGGEQAKNDPAVYEQVLDGIDRAQLCRWSYVLAIGGGAVLDVVGFAAATAHRGVRLVRMPTTTLAQADSGVGVKNGINRCGKKNFLGTFAVPWAVINDRQMLRTLSDDDWRCGLSEAVKVALLKSPDLFEHIESHAAALARRDERAADEIWRRSARLHFEHITAGGDPFETTRARPLDFGHWAAHQIEQLSGYRCRHGNAVAIGLALDVTYAAMARILPESQARRIRRLLGRLGFTLYDDTLDDRPAVLAGLQAFRRHLGGPLTVTLIQDIGRPIDVHQIDHALMCRAIAQLQSLADKTPIG